MRVAITGGTGFVGRALVEHLALERALTVRILTRGGGAPAHGVEQAQVDYRSPDSLAGALAGVDAVVHLAGIAHADPKPEQAALYDEAITAMTLRLHDACARAGCPRLVFASTTKVYADMGAPVGQHVDETHAPSPAGVYGAAKYRAELGLCARAAASGVAVHVLRLPPLYGPGGRGAVRHLLRAARRRWPLPLFGIDARRTFLYVGNAARMLHAAAMGMLAAPLYVADDGVHWTVGEFYAAAWRAAHGSVPPRWARWSMPPTLAGRLARVSRLAPLFANFPLRSVHRQKITALGLVAADEALRLSVPPF